MPALTIAKSLNKAYRKVSLEKAAFETFKKQLEVLFEQIDGIDTEEKIKGDLMDFLKLTFYGQSYKVSPNGKIDCAIHLGSSIEAPIGVIFEVKMPSNTSEMTSRENLNKKALQELLLYYLRERVSKKNIQLKHLVITNIYEFYIFDAQEFERVFYSDKKLLKKFEEFSSGTLTSDKTDFFYKEIAAEAIDSVKDSLTYTWFDIRKYKNFLFNGQDKPLIELYKIFSPEHLIKKAFQKDINSLNTKFYSELLYIIGLEEVEDKDSHKRIITRRSLQTRNPASILENAITTLDSEDWLDNIKDRTSYGNSKEEQLFNVALTLSIGWINRILFLKLLEAQLVKYHKGDTSWSFLSPQNIPDYDELNKLFFQVLAKRPNERADSINTKFGRIPYLNSSLFEVNNLERQTIRISSLDNSELPISSDTVLKDGNKPRYKQLPTLRYLLEFLDAYDFSSEGSEEILETAKTLINASVLGLIFEKINGHKDGSVFTPAAITMYMSREAVRATVVRKFNEDMGWNCADYEALKNKDIDDFDKANSIIDSIKICDPAVGSGHYLVSVLNELIHVKYDLGILLDCEGRRIKKQDWVIDLENDELLVTDSDGEPFNYIPGNEECQRIQEALFNQKRKIIENCLFGVDLNPNAVNICRLRLWIELLKNAYYTKESGYTELETLPNIDINIKTGNSLIHRFDLGQDISEVLSSANISVSEYKSAVSRYKNAHSKEEKKELETMISSIKSTLRTQISYRDPRILRKTQLEGELSDLLAPGLFGLSKKELAKCDKQAKVLKEKITKLNVEIEEIKTNKMYIGAFEWRIEFPEILDDSGNFIGFDCIIGNPPYIQLQKMGESADALQKMGYETYERTGDIYCLFYEMGMKLLHPGALLSFITSNKWMRAGYGEALREYISSKYDPILLIDFANNKIFDSATVLVNILTIINRENNGRTVACSIEDGFDINKLSDYVVTHAVIANFSSSADSAEPWSILSDIEQAIKAKIEAVGTPLKDWDIQINYGIKTGYNEAFIIDTAKRETILFECRTPEERQRTEAIIRPILRGRDIQRYSYDWAGLWLVWIPWHFPLHLDNSIQGASEKAEIAFMEKYPAVYQHLLQYKDKLSARNKAETGIRYEWYALQRWGANYWEDFSKPKIIYPNMTKFLPFYYDTAGFLTNQKCFIITGEHLGYLTAFLNSSLFKFCFADHFPELQGKTRELSKIFIDEIPVLRVNEETELAITELIRDIQAEYSVDKAKEIDRFIFNLYHLSPEEQEVIGFIDYGEKRLPRSSNHI